MSAFRRAMAICLALLSTSGVIASVAPASALAGSRDVEGCTDVLLSSSRVFCDNHKGFHEYYYEVESWNSNGEGVGSCAGVSSELGRFEYGYHCVGDVPSGFDEAYCLKKCEGQSGYGFVKLNSVYASYFTVWVWWA